MMNKKIITTTLIASLVIFNMSLTVFAAPASSNIVVTGRTEQNNQTGIIKPAPVEGLIYHNVTTGINFTGTIVIDGPELVLTVADPDGNLVPSNNITVVKIADKTYTYSVKVDPSKFKGNVNYTFNAKTIYINGKAAGQTHTSAPEQRQSIHVAYVSGFEYTDFSFGTYDRGQNKYPYSYDLVKVWDDGTKVPQNVTGTISGTGVVTITGEDPTYDGGSAIVGTEIPPVNILSFATENPVWTFNDVTKLYDLSFTLIKNLSNGQNELQIINETGITPLATYSYLANDLRSRDYSKDFSFTAPAAPIPAAPVVSNVAVSNIGSQWTGNKANGGNVQETYTLSYEINGVAYSKYLNTNFTKNGTGLKDQNLTYDVLFNGVTVNVSYTLIYIEPTSTDENTTTGNNGH